MYTHTCNTLTMYTHTPGGYGRCGARGLLLQGDTHSTYCLVLTAYCALLTAHCSLLTTSFCKAAPSGVVPVSLVRARQVTKPTGAKMDR